MNRRLCAAMRVIAIGLAVICVPATPGIVSATGFDLSIDVGQIGNLIWQIWQSRSAEEKKAVPVQDLVAQMNLLVGQRESFLPRFDAYLNRAFGDDPDTRTELRNQAAVMFDTAKRIQGMVRNLDSTFAINHSEVHIETTSIAESRLSQSAQTIRVLSERGIVMDTDDLLRRLRSGTCDLRQAIRNIQIASNIVPGPLSLHDQACGVK